MQLARNKKLLFVFMALLLAAMACLGGGNNSGGNSGGGDANLAGTQAALEATQSALENASPTNPPPPPPSSGGGDSGGGDSGGGDSGGGAPASGGAGTCNDTAANYSSGDTVLYTDFNDAECWGTFQYPSPSDANNPDYSVTLYNNALYVEVYAGNTTAYATYDALLDLTDVQVAAGVTTVSGPNTNNISLICRGTADGWYEFSMTSGGEWFIYKVVPSKPSISDAYELLANGFSDHYLKLQYNEMGITCIGDTLSFFILQRNGDIKMVGQVQDRAFRQGQIAVSVYSYPTSQIAWNYSDTPMGVEFNWVEITVP